MEQNVGGQSHFMLCNLGYKPGVTGVGILRLFRKSGICAVKQRQAQTKLLQKTDLDS